MHEPSDEAEDLATAIERNRRRVWAVCYRMTGNRVDADDLAQEALGRALERGGDSRPDNPTAWLITLATRVCLDHLRKVKVRRRLTELVDPLDEPAWANSSDGISPENELILEQDLRFAIVVALQALSPRQRAAVILRDVCGQPLLEVAATLSTNENALKALLLRGRQALREARGHNQIDVPADNEVVERLARAIQAGSVEDVTALLADDVWGVADGGGVVVTARKPTYGRSTVSKQWANAKRKLRGAPVDAQVVWVNGERAILVYLREAPEILVSLVHLETRSGQIVAQRVLRDPKRLAHMRGALHAERTSEP